MVKGISRQVIVLHSPDPKMFEQAIFILRDGQQGVTDEMLLKEANKLISRHYSPKRKCFNAIGPAWAVAGALFTGMVWLVTVLL